MVQYTARDVVKKLEESGFVEVRITGDHHIFKHVKTGRTIAVPYARLKSMIALGTAKQILKFVDRT